MKPVSRFILMLLTAMTMSVSCSVKLERSMLDGMYTISIPEYAPSATGDWTDGLRRYVEFNGIDIQVYYELHTSVKVPVNNSSNANIIEDGKYYRIDQVISYFKSTDPLDKNLVFTCEKNAVNTNIFFYKSPMYQYKVKENSGDEIVLEGSNHTVVLTVVDQKKLKSLKNAEELDYEGIKAIGQSSYRL